MTGVHGSLGYQFTRQVKAAVVGLAGFSDFLDADMQV